MTMIRIDRNMVIEDLYALRAEIPVENEAARDRVDKIVNMLANAPQDEKQSNFPRTSMRRG